MSNGFKRWFLKHRENQIKISWSQKGNKQGTTPTNIFIKKREVKSLRKKTLREKT